MSDRFVLLSIQSADDTFRRSRQYQIVDKEYNVLRRARVALNNLFIQLINLAQRMDK